VLFERAAGHELEHLRCRSDLGEDHWYTAVSVTTAKVAYPLAVFTGTPIGNNEHAKKHAHFTEMKHRVTSRVQVAHLFPESLEVIPSSASCSK
jgi:hypothetical protein